jgi:hypothetical protein
MSAGEWDGCGPSLCLDIASSSGWKLNREEITWHWSYNAISVATSFGVGRRALGVDVSL